MLTAQPASLSKIDALGKSPLSKILCIFRQVREALGARLTRIPPAAAARALVLFLTLVAIKIVLAFALEKQIFEAHWRVPNAELTRLGCDAFVALVLIGAGNLFTLSRHCRQRGSSAVRMANGCLLAAGFFFILLTFHEGQNNLLYPILIGVLPWSSIGSYLSVNFFFGPPFLGAWVFAYAFVLYLLIRSGREKWSLELTAVFAVVYAFFNLRDLAIHQDELVLIDCLGLMSLIAPVGAKEHVSFPLRLLPWVWGIPMIVLMFRCAPENLGLSFTYFTLVAAAASVLFLGLTLLACCRGFGRFWFTQLLFYFVGFLLLANSNHPRSPNFNRVLCLGLEFPHYLLGAMLVGMIFLAAAATYRKALPRFPVWPLDLMALGIIGLALVDLRLSQLLGTRLGSDVLALGGSATMMWRMARPYLPLLLLVLGVVAAAYAAAVRFVADRIQRGRFESEMSARRERSVSFVSPAVVYVLGSFITLGLAGLFLAAADKAEGQSMLRLISTSRIWKQMFNPPMTSAQFVQTARDLGLGTLGTSAAPVPSGAQRDLNVVLVFMESSYNQHLSLFGSEDDTEPQLSRYKDRMELFPNFFSNFASSIHARFAAFTSLYPSQDYNEFTLRHIPVKSIFEVLHEHGYHCSLFYSSFIDYTGFRGFLAQRGLDEIYDADTMPGVRKTPPVSWGLKEEETLGAMRAQLRKRAMDRKRFFLTYVPAAPHYPYDAVPKQFQKYQFKMGDCKPLYLNELLYMDWVLASLVDELKSTGLLEKTLVVITDDHGEMLGGNGSPIGHGWLLNPGLVNAPLIFMDPAKKGFHVNPAIGSQVDLLPTLLGRLNIPLPLGQLYEGQSLDGPHDERRITWLNSFQQFALLTQNRLVFGDREKNERSQPAVGDAFHFTNQGAKTIFEGEGTAPLPASISEFDNFQENLLRNYSLYADRSENPQPAPLASARKSN